MTRGNEEISSITGAFVMDVDGTFAVRDQVSVSGGRFTSTPPDSQMALDGDVIDASGLWLIPGVYDCHTHISWNDFYSEDRARRTEAERYAQTLAALDATLRAGVVGIRDAGGAPATLRDSVSDGSVRGPRLQVSVDMLGPDVAGDEDRVRAAVETALDRGAQWIKLIATESIGNPSGSEVGSHFTDAEFRIAVELASARGARVMVHAWGGRAISAAIDAGAASIEHGIFMTAEQCDQASGAGMTLVPTLSVYHDVQKMVLEGSVHGISPDRMIEVVTAHKAAVGTAYESGLPLALGSDFAMPEQHGRNLVEISALMRAGVSGADALLAATRNGAALLGIADGGSISDGFLADAVLLRADPSDPATFEDARNVAAVLMDGVLVHVDPSTVSHRPSQNRSTTE
jgi:imidazolonepropionase-like amidohydrolase